MVKNNIKVYLRIKKDSTQKKTVSYEIVNKKAYDNLVIRNQNASECCPKSTYKFRFLKALDQDSSQLDVFDSLAKPVVNSVINGFNGTIFAYGQTGSGKTYAITGSPKEYNDRGIIPRSIEHIFEHLDKSPYKYTIYISYLEIYNEAGYDLLNARHKPPSHMEELPRVVLLEDGKGEYHLRNLSVHSVSTVQEAMRLLFLGDTNRTIVETPMNQFSSRSHCVFTIYICSRGDSGSIRRSKLNLVDLAGSERVYKSHISGQTLTEAKYINLSLLYLEQVITALAEAKRPHIPFRNSMMTYMLKDSLNGNSLATMLATVSISVRDVEETISTCKFAQRVSLVTTEPTINEEVDFQQQIEFLSKENTDLRKQLTILRTAPKQESKPLTIQDEDNCRQQVEQFFNDSKKNVLFNVEDSNKTQFCFNVMKQLYQREKSEKARILSEESENKKTVEKYRNLVDQKDDEIFNELVETLSRKSSMISLCPQNGVPKDEMNPIDETILFENFAADPNNKKEIDQFNNAIQSEYLVAGKLAQTIEELRKEIIRIKGYLETDKVKEDEKTKYQMMGSLVRLQDYYQKTLIKMQDVKRKTEHLKHGLEQAKTKLRQLFDNLMRDRTFSKVSAFSGGSYPVPVPMNYGENQPSDENVLKRIFSQDFMTSFDFRTQYFDKQFPVDQECYKKVEEFLELSPIKLRNDNSHEDFQQQTIDRAIWCEPKSIQTVHQAPSEILRRRSRDKRILKGKIRHAKSETHRRSYELLNTHENNPEIPDDLPLKPASSQITSNYSLINNFSNQTVRSLESKSGGNYSPMSCSSLHNRYSYQDILNDGTTSAEHLSESNKTSTSKISSNTSHRSLEPPREESVEEFSIKIQSHPSDLIELREGNAYHSSEKIVSVQNPSITHFHEPADENLRSELSKISLVSTISEHGSSRQEICLGKDTDTPEFLEFMKTMPLTGDPEVDSEIYSFYREKFSNHN